MPADLTPTERALLRLAITHLRASIKAGTVHVTSLGQGAHDALATLEKKLGG